MTLQRMARAASLATQASSFRPDAIAWIAAQGGDQRISAVVQFFSLSALLLGGLMRGIPEIEQPEEEPEWMTTAPTQS